MKTARTVGLVLAALLVACSAWAGVIAPGLEAQMQSLKGDDEIKVLVVLSDQADVAALSRQLHDARVSRQERNQAVLGALAAAADRSQGALLDHLALGQRGGAIRGYTPHWLINAVVVVGTVDAVRELALRGDVAVIEPDLQVELIEPVPSEKPTPPGGYRSIGMAPGIEAVQAPRV